MNELDKILSEYSTKYEEISEEEKEHIEEIMKNDDLYIKHQMDRMHKEREATV